MRCFGEPGRILGDGLWRQAARLAQAGRRPHYEIAFWQRCSSPKPEAPWQTSWWSAEEPWDRFGWKVREARNALNSCRAVQRDLVGDRLRLEVETVDGTIQVTTENGVSIRTSARQRQHRVSPCIFHLTTSFRVRQTPAHIETTKESVE